MRSNPFSSRFVRPGALPFLAPRSRLEALVEMVAAGGRWAIVGPHGTGKTTLVHHLRSRLELDRSRPSRLVSLHDGGQRRRREGTQGVLFIDGYEQLSRLGRWRWAAMRDLVVTAHAPPRGFSVLTQTAVDDALAMAIVARLVARAPAPVAPRDAVKALRNAEGNMRDALIALYRVHEAHAAPGPYATVQ